MKKIIVKKNKKRTIVVIPKIQKSLTRDDYEIGLVNFITALMERDYIERALTLINLFFDRMTLTDRKQLVPNIIQATEQYQIPSSSLPESYYDFLVSADSDSLFFL